MQQVWRAARHWRNREGRGMRKFREEGERRENAEAGSRCRARRGSWGGIVLINEVKGNIQKRMREERTLKKNAIYIFSLNHRYGLFS